MLSQEMSSAEVGERALSNMGSISYESIQTGALNDRDWTELADAMQQASNMPFWVDDQPALRLSDIRAKARAVPGLRVLILDYLQLSVGDGDNRNAEIEAISRGLKQLAKELQIAVLMLSQLNRKVEERQNKEPQLSDLRDSGSIEQDADVVIFLWPLRDLSDSSKLVGLKVEKNRGGRLGRVALEFRGWRQHWAESNQPIYLETKRQESRL
jgi:replicative DNA helicase